MNTKIVLALLGGLTLASAGALAQQTTPDASPPAAPAAAPHDDPDEIICHPGEPILGSRLPGPRVCRTRREWNQIQEDAQKELYRQQMQRAYNSNTGG